jgi:hypothetical protein
LGHANARVIIKASEFGVDLRVRTMAVATQELDASPECSTAFVAANGRTTLKSCPGWYSLFIHISIDVYCHSY